MKTSYTLGLLTFLLVGGSSFLSYAQLDNKPFSFKGTPDGGIGMSIGGRQAILNQKILGVTPENLVRAPNGVLLDVVKGPGQTAIVSQEGGGTIPSYHGLSYKGQNENMSVGVFNAYFSPNQERSSTPSVVFLNSSALVSTWTGRVVSGGVPVSYSPNSSVDTWTGMVY